MASRRGDKLDKSMGSEGDAKKKDDTTPAPTVDKDVTPSEDDKKKKDGSTDGKKQTTTTSRGTRGTHLTENTELSSSHQSKRGQSAGLMSTRAAPRKTGLKAKTKKQNKILNEKLKHLKKVQARKFSKHPRSFATNIMRILKSVNESQEEENPESSKRVNQLSMMIFDSFANDLCDKLINAGVELMKNSEKRRVGASEIKSAMKLVLPQDMAVCCEEAVEVSLANYRESTAKYQAKIAKHKGNKKIAAGKKD